MGNCSQEMPQTTTSPVIFFPESPARQQHQTRNCWVIRRRDKARRERTSLMENYYNRTGSNFVFFLRGLMPAAYQPTRHIIRNNSSRLWRSLCDRPFVYVQTRCGLNHFAAVQGQGTSRLLPSERLQSTDHLKMEYCGVCHVWFSAQWSTCRRFC